jgi:hypothetical protein
MGLRMIAFLLKANTKLAMSYIQQSMHGQLQGTMHLLLGSLRRPQVAGKLSIIVAIDQELTLLAQLHEYEIPLQDELVANSLSLLNRAITTLCGKLHIDKALSLANITMNQALELYHIHLFANYRPKTDRLYRNSQILA